MENQSQPVPIGRQVVTATPVVKQSTAPAVKQPVPADRQVAPATLAPVKKPVLADRQAVVPVAQEQAVSGTAPVGGEQVLLVEDDLFLNSLLKGKLERAGIKVRLVTDGEMAIDALAKMDPAPKLVLLDLILPKKSGFEVLEEIHSSPQLKGTPVIILSNLGQNTDMEKGKQLGAVEYYVKAKTSIDDLANKVTEFISKNK